MMRLNTGMTLMLAGVLGVGTMAAQSTPPGTTGGTSNPSSTTAGSAAGSQMAQGTNPNMDPTALPPSDSTFVKKAIRGSNGEIDAAKLALQKSQNQQVKDYAQKMIDDHTKLLDDMHTVAQQNNIKFQDEPTPSAQKLHAKLEKLDGTAFDKAYVDGMVKDHKEDVRDFSQEVNSGKKQDVKDAATKGLPVIKEHLDMIQGIKKSMAS